MSYKTLYVCIACTLLSTCIKADDYRRDEITGSGVMIPEKLGNVRLFHQDNNFVVERDGKQKDIQSCFVSTDIRNISPELLSKFIAADNYLKLSELENTDGSVDYKLDVCNRLRGGGPVLGAFTFLGGAIATGLTATGVLIVTLPVSGPGAAVAAAATAKAGMVATAYATVVATGTPAP